jgi:hypothetical protein
MDIDITINAQDFQTIQGYQEIAKPTNGFLHSILYPSAKA